MRIDNVCAEGCTAAWCPPEDDGGSPVQYYIVERVQVSMLLQYDQITIFGDLLSQENCPRKIFSVNMCRVTVTAGCPAAAPPPPSVR